MVILWIGLAHKPMKPDTNLIYTLSAAEVLYCLLSDKRSYEDYTYEEFVNELCEGMNSKSSSKMYHACGRIASELTAMFTEEELEHLEELLEGY